MPSLFVVAPCSIAPGVYVSVLSSHMAPSQMSANLTVVLREGGTMAASRDPEIQKRRIRRALRRYREQVGMTLQNVADELDWSMSKVIRIELGTVGVSSGDLRAMLSLYGVSDPQTMSDLVSAAKISRKRSWIHEFQSVIRPEYGQLISYEAAADSVRVYHPTLIPGLLQTEAYTREIRCQSPLCEPEELQRRVELLHRRQLSLERPPPRFTFLVDEAALRRRVGGANTMLGQVRRLRELIEREWLTIRIVLFTAGAHGSLSGPLFLIELPDDEGRVLFLEGSKDDTVIEDDTDTIDNYEKIFLKLESIAETEEQSTAILDELLDEYAKAAA